MKPFALELQDMDPVQAFARVQHFPYSLFMDSADQSRDEGRYSYVMSHPREMIEAFGKKVRVTNREQQTTIEGDPFTTLQERMDIWSLNLEPIEDLPPFQGGAAGLFGYDLARVLEDLPSMTDFNAETPDMAFGIYDQVLAFDHKLGKCWLITQAADEDQAKRKRRPFLSLITGQEPRRRANTDAIKWEANKSIGAYKANIESVIDYILDGDVFQVNLSQHFEADLPRSFDTFEHYRALREINPAPFSAYMNIGPLVISSASPEQFLHIQGGEVTTKPIKGTQPRVEDEAENEKNIEALKQSAKDFAENVMIVDLLRNDLSKVCEAKSIDVPKLCELETFASVHHLVSTVKGTLKDGCTSLDAMRACFPGGSVTGAPKLRSMEIIEEIETVRRGAYCGSIAYIGFDGTMNSSILIRTLVYEGDKIRLNVGGGITAKSKPEEEHQETLDKAEAIFRSFDTKGYWRKTAN